MAIDISAVARVTGIEPVYKNLRGGAALFLPQRIMVFAQGATSSVYASTKYSPTSAAEVGSKQGYGSPAHLIMRELMPANGDGVGTIPVTLFPLSDAGGSAAAAGDITPSGTQTTAAAYRVAVSEIETLEFIVPVSATVSAICRLMHDAVNAVLHMPVTATYTYSTPVAAADAGNTGDGTVTALSATGTPQVGVWTLTCNTAVSDGGVFTLTDPDGTVASATVTMTPGAGGATIISQSGLQFTITDGAADFIVGDEFTITVAATKVDLTSKWKGVSANDLYVEVTGDSYGVTYAITQPTGGLVNPTLDAALAQVGNVWETMGLNALNIEDTTALDTIKTWGDGRWGALVRKPAVFFTGVTDATVAAATAISSARTTDKINAQLVAPGSKNLPCVVAARQLVRIAKTANNNPPQDYGRQVAIGLTPGLDSEQWTFAQRDAAVKAGSSTVEIVDGEIQISDVVTFYAPVGEEPPAYRYVVDIVKLMNVIYNIDLIFADPGWAGAPLIPDDQPTVNGSARRPSSAVTAVNNAIQGLADQAILSNPAAAKASTTAVINSGNPKRLDVATTVQLSGNTNIIDVTLNWGFYFGAASAV